WSLPLHELEESQGLGAYLRRPDPGPVVLEAPREVERVLERPALPCAQERAAGGERVTVGARVTADAAPKTAGGEGASRALERDWGQRPCSRIIFSTFLIVRRSPFLRWWRPGSITAATVTRTTQKAALPGELTMNGIPTIPMTAMK